MPGHTHAVAAVAVWPLTLMWFGMMAAMMAPTAWPWVRAFHRFNLDRREGRLGGAERAAPFGATARFGAGYLAAWLGYALGAALLQRVFERAALMSPFDGVVVPGIGAVIFLVAGLYQFAPLKRACLTHCRTPLGYFLTRWRNGPIDAFRVGLHRGLFCVGCCWAMMLTVFAVGMMSVWWMGALGVLALLEQIAPEGQMLRRALGGAFVAAAIARIV